MLRFLRLLAPLVALVFFTGAGPAPTPGGHESELWGTYRLVSTTFKLVDTGEEETWSKDEGYITYTREGRMFVIIIRDPRPHPVSIEKTTDAERALLTRTANAYSGPYTFDGKDIVHHIDLASNGVWNGTDQVRHARLEGNRVILTTDPLGRPTDGRMATTTLIWEKVK